MGEVNRNPGELANDFLQADDFAIQRARENSVARKAEKARKDKEEEEPKAPLPKPPVIKK